MVPYSIFTQHKRTLTKHEDKNTDTAYRKQQIITQAARATQRALPQQA